MAVGKSMRGKRGEPWREGCDLVRNPKKKRTRDGNVDSEVRGRTKKRRGEILHQQEEGKKKNEAY